MAPEWIRVWGKTNVMKLNKSHCAKFGGLNPDVEEDQINFGRSLGFTKRGVLYFFNEMHDVLVESNKIGQVVPEQHLPKERGDAADRIYRAGVIKDLDFLTLGERVNIYLRWRKGGLY